MKPFGLWARGLGLSVVLASTSWAQLSLWTARGAVSFIREDGNPPARPFELTLGTPLEITFLVDRSVPARFSADDFAMYSALYGNAKIGEQTVAFVQPTDLIVANAVNHHQAYFYSGSLAVPGVVSFGLSLSSGLTWKDDLSIPTSLPPLLQFNVARTLSLSGGNVAGWWSANATIDSITISEVSATPVPEASTYGLFSAVIVVLVIGFRKRATHLQQG